MQAATQLKTGREALFGDEQVGAIKEDVNLNAFRFFVQMGWSVLGVDSHAIPNSYLLRGEITPCRSYRQKANLVEIREGDLIPGSEERDKDGRLVWGSYVRYAYHEAERLIWLETRAERKTALFEVTALNSDLGGEVYRKVNLNAFFFPEWPKLPEKHEDVISLLQTRLAGERSHPADLPAHYWPIIFAVGDQLLEAARLADFIQRDLLTYTHTCLKLTPKDDGFKRSYDSVDYEMLRRTGIPEVHAAEIQTAQALEKLSERDDVKELIKMQSEQLALMREESARSNKIIEMLMAERAQSKGSKKEKE